MTLAFHDVGVQDRAGVVAGHDLGHSHFAGFGVYFSHHHMRSEGVAAVGIVAAFVLQGHAVFSSGCCHIGPALRHGGRALHMECACLGVQDHIFRIGFQQLRSNLTGLIGDLAGRIVNRRAAELKRAGTESAGAFCHSVGIALDDFNVVYVHT